MGKETKIGLGVIAVLLVVFAVVLALRLTGSGEQSVAAVAHLGGIAFGYLYYRFAGRPGFGFQSWISGMKRRVEHKRALRQLEEDEEVDVLLEKINREGMNSLTDGERQFLVDAARRRRNRK